jgi:uncharacterized RDD family membrane protein YckC
MRELTVDTVTIETPEHVVLTYELAGGVSRAVAALIDACFQAAILLAAFVVFVVGGTLGNYMAAGEDASLALYGLFLVASFLDVMGYALLFELFMRGQTPGKRFLGLRVISEGGYALTASAVLVRNLLRIADFVPFGYFTGLVVMSANSRNKRIGDFVAGTLVIRDVPAAAPDAVRLRTRLKETGAETIDALRRAGVHRLGEDHVRVVESFLERREGLDMADRRTLGRDLAGRVAGVVGVVAGPPEVFLMDVLAAWRAGR